MFFRTGHSLTGCITQLLRFLSRKIKAYVAFKHLCVAVQPALRLSGNLNRKPDKPLFQLYILLLFCQNFSVFKGKYTLFQQILHNPSFTKILVHTVYLRQTVRRRRPPFQLCHIGFIFFRTSLYKVPIIPCNILQFVRQGMWENRFSAPAARILRSRNYRNRILLWHSARPAEMTCTI